MIKKITSNIRSIQRDLEFSKPVTVIVGPNRSGKTSILDAITLIIAGFIPRLGKINAKLAPIIGWNGSASITATLDNGNQSAFRLMGNEADGFSKKQSLDQDHISKSCFDARLFLNSGSTDRIAIIQNSLGATQKVDVRQSTWEAAKAAYDAAGGEAGGIQGWKHNLFPTDASEFATESRKAINCKIADTKSAIDQYQGAYLTSLERSDTPPEYSAENHRRDHAEYDKLVTTRNKCEAYLNMLDAQIPETEKAIAKEKARAEGVSGQLPGLKKRQQEICAEINKLGMELAHKREHLHKAEESESEVCPTCGSKKVIEIADDDFIEAQMEIRELESKHEELDSELEDLMMSIAKASVESNLDELEDRLNSLCAQKDEQLLLLPKTSKINELALKLNEHEADQFAYQSFMNEREAETLMISRREAAAKNLLAFEAAKKALDAKLAQSAADVLGPVMGTANAVLSGILPYPLTHRGFALGYNTPQGVWVPIEGFSGSETEAALIGFTAGLASQEKFKVAIMDEAGMLDQDTFQKLLHNIEVMIEKKILDQVFIAGTGFQVEETELTGVIRL